jgi:hypothetical protein
MVRKIQISYKNQREKISAVLRIMNGFFNLNSKELQLMTEFVLVHPSQIIKSAKTRKSISESCGFASVNALNNAIQGLKRKRVVTLNEKNVWVYHDLVINAMDIDTLNFEILAAPKK